MNKYKLELMKKEFTFLQSFDRFNLEEADEIKIKRVDENLLKQKGYEDSYSWSGGGHEDYTKYFAVTLVVSDEKKSIVELDSAGHSATGSGDHNEWDADTVGEQLFTMSIMPDYIVKCVRSDTDDNGNGEVTSFWTIFKMNKFNLVEHHKQQIDKAAAELKAEIAVVCDKVVST